MSLDWDGAIHTAAEQGQLAVLLSTLPPERWTEWCPHSWWTFLHYAARGENVAAVPMLLARGLKVNAREDEGRTPAHVAALNGEARVLEALCIAGAALDARARGDTPLEVALRFHKFECALVLMAYGARLGSIPAQKRYLVTPNVARLECGVLRCRSAVVAMLRVKKAGNLVRWDRFLVAALATTVWATRCAKAWQ